MPADCLCVGWDVSPTHFALIGLDSRSRIVLLYAVTTKVGNARCPSLGGRKGSPLAECYTLSTGFVTCLPAEIRNSKEYVPLKDMRRFAWISTRVAAARSLLVSGTWAPLRPFVAIEDYAFGALGRAHSTGEVGGQVRLGLFRDRVPFRLYDPGSLKIFASGSGKADKEEMAKAAKAKWEVDFEALGFRGDVAGDLVDAYALARLLGVEMAVRRGEVTLGKLSEEERRVFLRVTQNRPVNLLDEPFIEREAGE